MAVAPAMTWLLVRTRPVVLRSTPVPAARALRRPRVLVMFTTLLFTDLTIVAVSRVADGARDGSWVAVSASPGGAGTAAPGRAAVGVGRAWGLSERASNIATSPAT